MLELVSGNINQVTLVETRRGLQVLRTSGSEQQVRSTLSQVYAEHLVQGFFTHPGNRLGFRTVEQQVALSRRLQEVYIPTPAVKLTPDKAQLIDYIPDTTSLTTLWLKRDARTADATRRVFDSLIQAHACNLTMGDRTGKNELVTSAAEIALIDFDISLDGPQAREFELVSAMFRISRAAQRGELAQLASLGELYKDILCSPIVGRIYNPDVLTKYLTRFADLSRPENTHLLPNMTPTPQPEKGAELFDFLRQIYHD